MSLILLVFGILIAGAGMVAIAFGSTVADLAIEVSGSALERLRSTVRPDRVVANGEDVPLSPNGSGHHHGAERKPEPRSEPEARPGAPAETSKEPRLDFLFRPKTPPRPP